MKKFEIGKKYAICNDIQFRQFGECYKVVSRTNDTLTYVEDYEECEITIPIKKVKTPYGTAYEMAEVYTGSNLYISSF